MWRRLVEKGRRGIYWELKNQNYKRLEEDGVGTTRTCQHLLLLAPILQTTGGWASSRLLEDGVRTRIVKDSDMTTRHRPITAKLELLVLLPDYLMLSAAFLHNPIIVARLISTLP